MNLKLELDLCIWKVYICTQRRWSFGGAWGQCLLIASMSSGLSPISSLYFTKHSRQLFLHLHLSLCLNECLSLFLSYSEHCDFLSLIEKFRLTFFLFMSKVFFANGALRYTLKRPVLSPWDTHKLLHCWLFMKACRDSVCDMGLDNL